MLGEVGEAEDAVQEAFTRWMHRTGPTDNANAWLTTVLSRICLDRLKSAQRTRETYVGPWLPEPLATDTLDPGDSAALADSLSLAFLVVLERLSPLERAAFLLHDVFGYRHDEVAAVAGADLDDLMALLAPDVTFVADGGGVVPAARHPLHGADRVARAIVSLARRRPADWTFTVGEFNGEPGIVVRRADGLWILHVVGGRVAGISVIRAPDKLQTIPSSTRVRYGAR